MATPLEIVRGISQVMANTYDGALDADGEPVKIGLKREEGHPINDARVMDGFSVKFEGEKLCIYYHAEVLLKDVYGKDFEGDIDQMITDISTFLKKEYKKITKSTLTLTPAKDEEVHVLVQNTSRIRTWVQAYKKFDIGGMGDTEKIRDASEDRLEDSFRKFLDQGDLGKRAKNDKRKE